MASLSCSVTYTCLAGATRPHFHGRTGPGSQGWSSCRKGCLSGFQQGMASLFAYPLLLFVMDYKLGRIYARTNAALVNRRGLARKSSIKSLLLFPVPNHAQIQSIPGLVGDPQCYLVNSAWERGYIELSPGSDMVNYGFLGFMRLTSIPRTSGWKILTFS